MDKDLFKTGIGRGWLAPTPARRGPRAKRYWLAILALSLIIFLTLELLSWLR